MARDVALVVTWAGPVRGREAKSLEVFMESLGFWAGQAAQGRCQQPEVFIAEDGSGGMLILKGKSDAMHEIAESEEGQTVIAKAQAIVEDLRAHWYYAGDEEIQRNTALYAQIGSDLGLM
jgi:hypothetical protein